MLLEESTHSCMFQTQINETDVSRVKKLEDEIYHINSDLKKTERRYEVNMIILSGNFLLNKFLLSLICENQFITYPVVYT